MREKTLHRGTWLRASVALRSRVPASRFRSSTRLAGALDRPSIAESTNHGSRLRYRHSGLGALYGLPHAVLRLGACDRPRVAAKSRSTAAGSRRSANCIAERQNVSSRSRAIEARRESIRVSLKMTKTANARPACVFNSARQAIFGPFRQSISVNWETVCS